MTCGDVTTRREALRHELEALIRGKAKPIGAMGRIEHLAVQIGLATGQLKPDLGKAGAIVFAGDHGITAEGVTAYPSEVTREVAKLILTGGAGISLCARAAGIDVTLVDCGLLAPLEAHDRLIGRRMGAGTRNARREAAMSEGEFSEAFRQGHALAEAAVMSGTGLFAFGEIGIGNTSAAALVGHTVTGLPLDMLVGPGAGVPPLGLGHKRQVLAAAVERAAIAGEDCSHRAFAALRQFAGFEMVMMAGAMTAAATFGRIAIVDGFIASAVASAVLAIRPGARDNLVFSHTSAEPGHKALLDHLNVRPLLDLGLRLGEGTGAVLALPIVRTAELMLRDMADLPGEHPQ